MKNSIAKCYMCDESAVSKEHVPPRCLFPKNKDLEPGKDLRKDLLTVPSCALHNSEKSGEDVYFLNVITSIREINYTGRQHYKKQIRRQNLRNSSIISRFAERSIEINSSLAFEIEIDRLDVFIAHLACALYLAHFNNKWDGNIDWYPEFLVQILNGDEEQKRIEMIKEIDFQFNQISMHGKNKEVFAYQVIEADGSTKMRLYFYGNCKVLLIFPKII